MRSFVVREWAHTVVALKKCVIQFGIEERPIVRIFGLIDETETQHRHGKIHQCRADADLLPIDESDQPVTLEQAIGRVQVAMHNTLRERRGPKIF